jgi:hypothetical protein
LHASASLRGVWPRTAVGASQRRLEAGPCPTHGQGPMIARAWQRWREGGRRQRSSKNRPGRPAPAGNHELFRSGGEGKGGNADGPWRRRRAPWMPPWWERLSGAAVRGLSCRRHRSGAGRRRVTQGHRPPPPPPLRAGG